MQWAQNFYYDQSTLEKSQQADAGAQRNGYEQAEFGNTINANLLTSSCTLGTLRRKFHSPEPGSPWHTSREYRAESCVHRSLPIRRQ